MTLVAVDPGLRECGIAVFVDGKLVRAALARNAEKKVRGPKAWCSMAASVLVAAGSASPDLVIVERMRINRGVNPDDILELQGVAGAVCVRLSAPDQIGYLAREWGGAVPKPVKNARVESKLTPDELAAIDPAIPASMRNHVLDAIGIGLYHLGRYR